MKTNFSDLFKSISIRGRFIYGYLCLNNAIKASKAEFLPVELNKLYFEFVSTDKLDLWHAKVEDIMPSFLLETENLQSIYFPVDIITEIKRYYLTQPSFIIDIIDDSLWIGASNLYVGYDSNKSIKYLDSIIEKMKEKSVLLPEFDKIEGCSSNEKHGWGNYDDLGKYLSRK